MKKLIALTIATIATIWSTTAQEPPFIGTTQKKDIVGDTYYVKGYYDSDAQQYVTKSDYIRKYGRTSFKKNLYKSKNITEERAISLNLRNVTAGSCFIGASLSAFLITDAALAKSIDNKTKELTELANATQSQVSNAEKIKNINDKINSLDKARTTMKYVYAGTSIAGIIIILSGLEYTNDGVKVAENLSFNGSGMTVRF